MRTNEEIVDRIRSEEVLGRDMFGFERGDLLSYLDFETAKQFLKTDAKGENWKTLPRDRESVLKQMQDYMEFAWDKANGKRGLSAGRSMSHYMAWVWVVGDDLGDLTKYEFYGKDNLVKICERYGWDHKIWDDGVRENY